MNMSNTNGFPFYASTSKTKNAGSSFGMNESSLECKIVLGITKKYVHLKSHVFPEKSYYAKRGSGIGNSPVRG